MEIVADSVKLTVDSTGVVPGVDITTDGRNAVLHLTKHAKLLLGETRYTEKEGSAINISGEVKARMNPRDDIRDWEFHFIQLAREIYRYVGYAGRAKTEGSMALNFAVSPLTPAKFAGEFCLDSGIDLNGTVVMPFTNLRSPNVTAPDRKGAVTVTTDMDDHPNAVIPLKTGNLTTKSNNFLYRASAELELLTVFVVRHLDDRTGKRVIQQLAYVGWSVTWIANFRWVGERCTAALRTKEFAVDPGSKGAVPDPDLADMITNPTDRISETYNYLTNWAQKHIYDPGVLQANLSEASTWRDDVPADFYQVR
jgi:hypothetical protein